MSLLAVASQSLSWGEVGIVGLLPLEVSIVSGAVSLVPSLELVPLGSVDVVVELVLLVVLLSALLNCIFDGILT